MSIAFSSRTVPSRHIPHPVSNLVFQREQLCLLGLTDVLLPGEPLLELRQLGLPVLKLQLKLFTLTPELLQFPARLQPRPLQVPHLDTQLLRLLGRGLLRGVQD